MTQTYLSIGHTHYDTGEYKKAKIFFVKQIALTPTNPEAYNFAGLCSRKMSRYKDAIKIYNQAITNNIATTDIFTNKSTCQIHINDLDGAFESLKSALKLDAKNAEALNNLGLVFFYKQNYPKALENFNTAIRLRLQDKKAYFNRAMTFDVLDKYKQAIADYKKYILANPRDAEAWFYLGQDLWKLGQEKEARKSFQKAIKIGGMWEVKAKIFLRKHEKN